jgi:hypothetical protein
VSADLVRLTIVANELEAEMVRALLTTHGIDSMQRHTNFTAGAFDGAPGAAGPREILVRSDDLAAALELLTTSSLDA